jgi:hypothetical protein
MFDLEINLLTSFIAARIVLVQRCLKHDTSHQRKKINFAYHGERKKNESA